MRTGVYFIISLLIFIILNYTYNYTITRINEHFLKMNRLAINETIINNDIYDDHADEWDDENGFARGLHILNDKKIEFIINKVNPDIYNSWNKTMLDVGCGGGLTSNKLQHYYKNIIGVDSSEKSILKAREGIVSNNVTYIKGDIYNLPFLNETFDVILLMDVLDHVIDIKRGLKECERVLKSGGILIFETINRNFKSCLLIKYIGEFLGFMPKNTHDCNLFISPTELLFYFIYYSGDFFILTIKSMTFEIKYIDLFRNFLYNRKSFFKNMGSKILIKYNDVIIGELIQGMISKMNTRFDTLSDYMMYIGYTIKNYDVFDEENIMKRDRIKEFTM